LAEVGVFDGELLGLNGRMMPELRARLYFNQEPFKLT